MDGTTGKVAIVGAGSVGATIAYTLMVRGIARELVLIDKLPDKARAEAMDLNHGMMFVPPVAVTHGTVSDCAGSRVIIVTAGVKQQPGQSRLALADANATLFRRLIPELVKVAPDAHLLIVSNPVDVLTDLALRLSGFPARRVIGSGTVLDTSRFRLLIGQYFNVSVSNIHAYIIGEHGDSEVALWSSAQIGNVRLTDVTFPGHPVLSEDVKREIVDGVRGAAGSVIRAKGATNWAVGLSVARILEAILRDERVVLTVSRQLTGYLGVGGVCLSVPCVVSRDGAESCLTVACDADELAAFRRSADVVTAAGARLA